VPGSGSTIALGEILTRSAQLRITVHGSLSCTISLPDRFVGLIQIGPSRMLENTLSVRL